MRKSSPKSMRVCPLLSRRPCIEIILHKAITWRRWSGCLSWSWSSEHHWVQSCKLRYCIRLRTRGKYAPTKTSLTDWSRVYFQNCDIKAVNSSSMWFLRSSFFYPNGIISYIRHKRGIVLLLNKSLPRHWQLSGTFVLWYHLQTPAQAFHICVKTTSL